MIVEELVANIGLNFTGVGAASSAIKSLDGIKAAAFGVGGILAAASGALTAVTLSVSESIAQMGDFGTAVGASVQNLQALTYAAEQNGGSFEDVSRGLRTLVDTAGNAAAGNESAAKSFAQVGVSVRGANGKLKDADTLMSDVADGLSKVTDPTARLTAAQNLLGKGAVKLLPAFMDGAAGLDALRTEAESIGYVLDKETIERFKNLDDAMDNLGARSKGLRNLLGKAFLPFVEKSVASITRLLADNTTNISAAFTRMANLIGKPFQLLGLVVQGLGSALDWLDEKLHGAKAAIIALVGAAAVMAAIFLFPAVAVIALTALVAIIAEDIYNFATGQPSLLGDVVKSWGNFKGAIREVAAETKGFLGVVAQVFNLLVRLNDITANLAKGNFKAAFDELGKGLEGTQIGAVMQATTAAGASLSQGAATSGLRSQIQGINNSPLANSATRGALLSATTGVPAGLSRGVSVSSPTNIVINGNPSADNVKQIEDVLQSRNEELADSIVSRHRRTKAQ